jgi:hypothetical protein
MSNIAFRSSAQAHGTGSSTLVINVPAGTVDGDQLVLSVAPVFNLHGVTTPSGWTLETAESLNNNHGVTTFIRTAASEPASYTLTFGTTADAAAIMCSYSNPDSGAPFDNGAVSGDGSSDTSHVQASVTTAHDNEILVLSVIYANNGTFTPPSGFTQRELVVTNGNNRTLVVCDMVQSTAGASGTQTATLGTGARSEGTMLAFCSSLITPQFWNRFVKSAEVDS